MMNYDNLTNIIFLIFISIVGLCIGIIMGEKLFNKIKYKGPDSNIVKKQILKDDKGNFRWKPKVCICPISHSMFKLKDKNYIDEH
jgi:uncharacterized protein YebE (UPF0316 family)